MPEQLRFGQRIDQVRAVESDEWAVGHRAQAVQRTRDEFLAGTRLSLDQHGGLMRGEADDAGEKPLELHRTNQHPADPLGAFNQPLEAYPLVARAV